MTETKKKVVKTVTVSYEEFSEWGFVPVGSFYVRNALGEYVFFKTSDRKVAQSEADSIWGKSKYSVVAAKAVKTESRQESGEYTCTGTASRRK